MAVLQINKFSGVAPRVSPNKLAPEMAQVATNVRLLGGTLASWKQPITVLPNVPVGSKTSIYRYSQNLTSDTQYWFTWAEDVDVVKSAIAGDTTERTYFTGASMGAHMTESTLALTGGTTYPVKSYPLGIPAPTAVPVATAQVQGDTPSYVETRFYVYTFVSYLGEEGPPSAVSNQLDVYTVGATTRLSGLQTTPPAGYQGYLSAKRIYRTLVGSAATEFQLVDEIPLSQATFDDNKPGTSLGEVIPTTTWTPPPAGAFGITQMANGITLLFKGYDIYPSEAYVPYAYPVGYQQSVDYPIVGGKAIGTSAVILTTGQPYLLTGSDPSAMSLVKLESPQACVSKRSIAAADGGVLYASPDGLIFVTVTGQVTNVTAQLFTRDEWQALVPSSINGYFHDGRYYGFYNTGTVRRGFIFDPAQGAGAFVFTDLYATAGYSDLLQDALYLQVGGNIVKWNTDAARMSYTWRSAIFELPSPINPACAQVTAKQYPLTFKLFADGELKHTQTVTSSSPFWMPSGYRAQFVELEISGTSEVLAVYVAGSPQELKGL